MKKLVYLLVAMLVIGCYSCNCQAKSKEKAKKENSGIIKTEIPVRPAGQTDVVGLRCDPIETVRVGFIGLGMRGPGAVSRFTHIPGVEIKALCDLYPDRGEKAQKI